MLSYITTAYFHDFIIIIVKHMRCKALKKMGKTFFVNTYFNNNNHLLTRETTKRNGNGGKTLKNKKQLNWTWNEEMSDCTQPATGTATITTHQPISLEFSIKVMPVQHMHDMIYFIKKSA